MEYKAQAKGHSYREYTLFFWADNQNEWYYAIHIYVQRQGAWQTPRKLASDLFVPVKSDSKTSGRVFQTDKTSRWSEENKTVLGKRLPVFAQNPQLMTRLQSWMLYHGLKDDDALPSKKRWEMGRFTVNLAQMLVFLEEEPYEDVWLPLGSKYERNNLVTSLVSLPLKKKNVKPQKFDVYIGRGNQKRGWNLPKSPWNFLYLRDSAEEHAEKLQRYGSYIYHSVDKMQELEKLRGLVLGCDCEKDTKKACHGTILMALLNGTFKPSKKEEAKEEKKKENKEEKTKSNKRKASADIVKTCNPKKLKIVLKL